MASILVAVVYSLCLLITVSQAGSSECSIDPISLPWANITLADGIAVNRGIDIQLGGQPISLRATTMLSNCRIRNARDCGFGNASAQSGCQGASGSSFNIEESPTWFTASQGTWNISTEDTHGIGETVIDGYDTAQFYGLPEIYGFPFEVWSNTRSDNKSGLALGPNSSFIETLLDAELVPSGNFGLFFGSRSQTKGVDGNLTIGGYDRARVGGSWANFTPQAGYISNPCPLQVMVKDIRLNNVRGSFSLFADSDATVVACVDPLQNQFTFTEKMYDLFANLTDHPTNPAMAGGSNFTQQTYPLANEDLLGTLTVELSNGYKTIIPHYELVSQERGTDAEGKYAVVNESRIMVAAGTTGTSTLDGVEVPILGGVYLSQNYLFVDYESGQFHLAPAVVGEMDDQKHDIVPVCGTSGFDASVSSDQGDHQGSKSNAGAIAGGVVGGLAVIVGGLLIFWYLRNKNKRNSRDKEALPSEEIDNTGAVWWGELVPTSSRSCDQTLVVDR
jgi:hypothetical protein